MPPPPGLVPSCAEGGVFGVLPGVIGAIQISGRFSIVEVAEGRQLHDPLMQRDFETLYVTHGDGSTQEIDCTFPLFEKGMAAVTDIVSVDPLDNEKARGSSEDGAGATDGDERTVEAEAPFGSLPGGKEREGEAVTVPGGGGRAKVGRGQRSN